MKCTPSLSFTSRCVSECRVLCVCGGTERPADEILVCLLTGRWHKRPGLVISVQMMETKRSVGRSGMRPSDREIGFTRNESPNGVASRELSVCCCLVSGASDAAGYSCGAPPAVPLSLCLSVSRHDQQADKRGGREECEQSVSMRQRRRSRGAVFLAAFFPLLLLIVRRLLLSPDTSCPSTERSSVRIAYSSRQTPLAR